MTRLNKVLVGFGVTLGVALLIYLGTLASIVFSSDPLNHALAKWPIWPIACTTRGCVTTASWIDQHTLAVSFSTTTASPVTTPEVSLTSTVRKHLISQSVLRSPVKTSDVQRYREDILHVVKESDLQQYIPLTLAEYDMQVLMPFLQQEALLNQNKVETTEELYHSLTEDHPVLLLSSHFRWDGETGSVQSR